MANQEGSSSDSHNMQINEKNTDGDHLEKWSHSIQIEMNTPRRYMTTGSGQDGYCIFRAPPELSENNEKVYKPNIISIGPFHHGEEEFRMMEEHKYRYLRAHLDRNKTDGEAETQRLKRYYLHIDSMYDKIKNCYSGPVSFNQKKLTEIMILDGCFLLELFTNVQENQLFDPLFNASWVRTHLEKDILQLENQIPFFVLEKLYELSRNTPPTTISIQKLALNFFYPSDYNEYEEVDEPKHLLHLLYEVLRRPVKNRSHNKCKCDKLTPSISKLRVSGVKLEIIKDRTYLDIRFKKNVLEIPCLQLDEVSISLLQNCVAFERCFTNSSHHFIDYISFISSLLITPSDVSILSEKNVIENGYGSYGEIATFFSKLNKQVCNNGKYSYLSQVIDDVNYFAENNCQRHWAEFKHKYFKSPWAFISAFGVVILLILTITQTLFTILQYLDDSK